MKKWYKHKKCCCGIGHARFSEKCCCNQRTGGVPLPFVHLGTIKIAFIYETIGFISKIHFHVPRMNKREGYPSSSLVTATFFQKNEPNLSHSNIFDVFYMISYFLHNFLFVVEQLQPFYIEMAPLRSPQALQHFWYVFYFVTLSPFVVEKLQAFYIGIAPSSSPQALQHSWYWFYFVMCLHPVSFFVLKNSRPSA